MLRPLEICNELLSGAQGAMMTGSKATFEDRVYRASLAKIIRATRLIARQDFEDFKPLTPPWCLIRDARWSVDALKRTMIRDRRKP